MCNKVVSSVFIIVVLSLVGTSRAQWDPNTDPSLVAWYTFDGDASDSSANGLHGTEVGDPEYVEGYYGEAIFFDGDGDYVDCGNPPELTIQDEITMAFWFKVESFTRTWEAFLAKGDDSYRASRGDGSGNATHMGISGTSAGGGNGWFNGTVIVTDNRWHHFAATYDGSAGRIYIDGKLDVTSPGTGQINESTYPLWIGTNSQNTDRYLRGLMDDVRFYSRALTADEVKSMVPPQLKAFEPNPADGATGVVTPLLQWSVGDTAMFHDVYLGTTAELTEANLIAPRQPFAMYYHIQGLVPGTTYYWRVDEIEADMVTVHTGNLWSFMALPLTAWAPSPADGGEKAAQAPTPSWLPGQGAMGHHVYFGDSFDAVKDGAAETDKGDAAETTFSAGLLRAGTTYYWRVDETDSAGEIQAGEVWSFTTGQPVVGKVVREWWLNNSGVTVAGLTDDPRYPGSPDGSELLDLFEGPTDWSDNYGCRLSGWLVPPESGDYTFWIASDDGSELWLSTDEDPANGVLIASVPTWVPARDFDNTGGGLGDADAQKSDPIALAAGAKYYIEALMNEGGGGDNVAVAWQVSGGTREVIPGEFVSTYALPPVSAAAPSPENGAADTVQSPVLSWFAGENAVAHHVYFGDDADAVAGADTTSAEYKGRQAGATYNPGALEWGKSYAWRVDEEEADGTVRTGAVWGFTTAAFLLIEDFESYTDNMDDGEAIFQTWIDGWENGTGSTVGYLTSINGTFGETSTVYTGNQSMPLDYNNVNSPYYSETSRTFAPAVNMTVGGMDTLTLFVRGQTGNDPAPLYIGLQSGATRVNLPYGDDTVVQTRSWVEVSVPLADFAGVNAAAVNEMFISLGNPDAPTSGGAGLVFIDAIRATKAAPATE